jgi:cobalt-zinc-cadmium efflux system outer membrane protein
MSRRTLFFGYTLGAVVLAGAGVASGQNAQTPAPIAVAPPQTPAGSPFPLPRAIELFRRQNLRLVAGRHFVSAARADAVAAGLISNPSLSFGAQFLTHGAVTGGKEEVSVMLAQRLPVTGVAGLRRDAADAAATAEEAAFAVEGWGLLADLKQAYLGLQRVQLTARVLTAGLGDLDRVQRVLDERARAGATPAYDRLRLEVERGGLRARISQLEVELVSARAELAHAIGSPSDELEMALADEPLDPPLPSQIALLVQRALGRRPELRAAHFRALAANLGAQASGRRYVPEPELGVGYTRFIDVPSAGGTSGGAALVSLGIPLPLWDHGQGTIRSYEERGRAATALAQDMRLRIEREVKEASVRLRVAREAYDKHQERVRSDVENVRRIAEAAYREGKATILELLDAYSSYLRVQEQGVALRTLALSAALDLERAVGP